jgi:predicted phosphoserine aminotransferase
MSSPYGQFFLPGPTEVHPEVLEAMTAPMIPHRGEAMSTLLEGMAKPLQHLFRTSRPVMIGSCSATGYMEMAVRSGVQHRVLSLVGGAFGARFAALAGACGREVMRLEVPLGGTIEPDMLRDALDRSEVDAVTMVHSETSTGALAPLEELAQVVHEHENVLLLVDAVTSLGGMPVESDAWKLDFVLTGSQKAMALPPGLALGVVSERMIERARTIPERGGYLDVVAHHEAAVNQQPTNTPAISLLFALARQLQRIDAAGGVEARWETHRTMFRRVHDWVAQKGSSLGVEFLPEADRRSWTVSCLRLPETLNGRTIAKQMADAGWVIGSGYGDLKTSTIRLGHMGDHTVEQVDHLLDVLGEILS